MNVVEPFLLRHPPKERTLFACIQSQGKRPRQEDYFINYNDECFVVADGVGGEPHGDVASKFAADTALWAYKHVRLRPFYWEDKKLFMKRIFRSSNLAVWQKQRETGFEDGMATTLLVVMLGTKTFWLGSVGDSSAFFWNGNMLRKLTTEDHDTDGYLTKAVGLQRLGLVPQYISGSFAVGNSLLLVTDGVTNAVDSAFLQQTIETSGTTNEAMTTALSSLMKAATQKGGTDNMTACLIKRISA